MSRYALEVEVRFRDLDPMGHAHHTLPLVYFEEARAAYWRDVAGRPELADIDYILASVSVRYHARILYPVRLRVEAQVTRLGERSFTMEYRVISPAGDLLASGETVQVMYDYENARSRPLPPEVRARIADFEGIGSE